MPDGKVCPEQFRGWLLKWTNYIKGYQKRWFVLSNGLLSYYRTQEEMAHTCRGTVNLAGAFIDTIDATNFVITNGPQVYYLRALNEVERQRWVTALALAKAKAIKNLESDSSEGEDGGGGVEGERGEEGMAALKKKMKELSAAHDVVVKNSHQLLKQITELEGGGGGHKGGGASGGGKGGAVDGKLREKLTLFRLTTDAMVKASEEYLHQARSVEKRWTRELQNEKDLRHRLQENLETMAKQIHSLENEAQRTAEGRPHLSSQGSKEAAQSSTTSSEVSLMLPLLMPTSEISKLGFGEFGVGRATQKDEVDGGAEGGERESEEEEKFFDAPEISAEEWAKSTRAEFLEGQEDPTAVPEGAGGPVAADLPPFSSKPMELMFSKAAPSFFDKVEKTLEVRRKTIPPKPNVRFNLWGFIKNSVGKDLTKLPMPVSINEPLSFLQRMVEDLIYADSLSSAVSSSSTLEELAYVAAFACSVYAQTSSNTRMTKPFNPMLGETYECDRRAESGWRCLLEQVSHHPPMFAMHVEHKDWTFWEEYTVASKFRGKYIACYPIGITHLVIHNTGSHYTWTKVVTTIHNIIIGNMWIDQSGPMKVTNHTTGEEALLKFHAYSYFSRERQKKVTGTVKDSSGLVHYKIKGYWDEYLEHFHVIQGEGKKAITELPRLLWKAIPHLPGNEVIYGFSEFASTLNEPEEGVAPTDSRLRPDQRIMEQGDFDRANKEKVRLEDQQRAKRRKREAAAAKAAEAAATGNHEEATRLERESTYSPLWFRKEYDSVTNSMINVYKGGYWEGKYSGKWGVEFPKIF